MICQSKSRPRSRAAWQRCIALCALVVASLAALGCVSSATHDEALARIQKDHARIRALDARIVACGTELADAQALAAAKTRTLQEALDQETATAAQLRSRLEELGQDVDKLLVDKGTLAVSLQLSKLRLEALRRAQAASEARVALFRDLAKKLKRMIDAKELNVLLREGRMVIVMPNDVLFDSGHVDIKPAGRESLKRLAAVLKTVEGRQFQVAGHTDTVPISTPRFPSNWELSTGRAVEVTRFLLAQGMQPGTLSAAGYGEFDPVAGNDSAEGRAKNRRIEMTLVPAIDEMVAVPE